MTGIDGIRSVRRRMAPGDPDRWVVVMAKTPRMGRVKTRLAKDIGPVAAAQFARQTLHGLVRRLGGDPRWRLVIATAPDRDAGALRAALGVPVIGQGGGDLGQRMRRAAEAMPPGPVVITGSDIPAIRPRHIADAFARLAGQDAVFGPSPDGGFWLVGLNRRPRCPAPFAPVRWSTAHALEDCLAGLAGKRVALTGTLADVDTAAEFMAWRQNQPQTQD